MSNTPNSGRPHDGYKRVERRIFAAMTLLPLVPFLLLLGAGYLYNSKLPGGNTVPWSWVVAIMLLGGGLIVAAGWLTSNRLHKLTLAAATESETLKEQLIRAARLAELGEMAAGFAHEINNPLQIMKSELTLMDMNLEDADKPLDQKTVAELRDSINQLELQIHRCARITAAILKFGRYGEPERQVVSLAAVVPEVVAMLDQKAMVEGVGLTVSVPQDAPRVYCDPGQLQQVLLNLLNNALDAVVQLHEEGGGKVDLSLMFDASNVSIVIRDNGAGISEEVREKVFSPFFTTKPVGKGTGLGLSICFGIVESMGGSIHMDSEPGRGTRFTVTLPTA